MKPLSIICFTGLFGINVSYGSVDSLLSVYQNEGASQFSATNGESAWSQESVPTDGGKSRACTSCHGTDLLKPGRHVTAGKVIKPMAPSVNPSRLTDPKKVEKWFRRNCRWTFGRECSPQEKGDFIHYLMTQKLSY